MLIEQYRQLKVGDKVIIHEKECHSYFDGHEGHIGRIVKTGSGLHVVKCCDVENNVCEKGLEFYETSPSGIFTARMKVKESKGKLKVGDWVRTNGSGVDRVVDWFEGEIGEIKDDKFYVWQNAPYKIGSTGELSPSSKGYSQSWVISFDNPSAEIEILKSSSVQPDSGKTEKRKMLQVLTAKIKRIFSPNLQSQFKAGLIDNCGELTSKGNEELQEIVRAAYDEELTKRAEEIVEEEKEKK